MEMRLFGSDGCRKRKVEKPMENAGIRVANLEN
jgi:hypothetical protein